MGPGLVAYHSAEVVGSYMLVYGGQMKRQTAHSNCISKDLYALHLPCNKWVDMDDQYGSLAQSSGETLRPVFSTLGECQFRLTAVMCYYR